MPILRIEEQCALQKAEYAINFENGMYRVGFPWRSNGSELPNYYKMALKRLENTEKKLARSPAVAFAYSETINQYIRKVVGHHEKNTSKWYLLLFPVIRPDKNRLKQELSSMRQRSVTVYLLITVIHKRPKLQQDLFDVLLRFR